MRFLKHRRLHVNMGNYEHVEVSATVEVDTIADAQALAEQDVDFGDPGDIHKFLDEQLLQMIQSDVKDADYLTTEDDSFIHDYARYAQAEMRKHGTAHA